MKSSKRFGLLAALACLPAALAGLLAAPAAAQPLHKVDGIFAAIAARDPGCAVGVARDGKTLFAKGYGLADLEHDVPVTARTPFVLASLTKQFTSFTALMLEKDGVLSLNDPIRKYVPELGAWADSVTLRQLLQHTGGARDYAALRELAGTGDLPFTDADFLKLMAAQKGGDFAPGTRFSYGNSGYALVALAIRRATGKNLDAVAREKLFTPLGMTSARFQHDHRALVAGRAVGYARSGDSWRSADSLSDVVGAGEMLASVDDMLAWAANLQTGGVGAEALAALQASATLTNGKSTNYGLGLARSKYRGLDLVTHNGGLPGYHATFLHFPNQRFTTMVLCNSGSAPAETFGQRIADLYLGDQFQDTAQGSTKAAPSQVAAKIDPKVLDAYLGDWRRDDNFMVSITRSNDTLMFRSTGLLDFPLVASSDRTFFFAGAHIRFAFDQPGADGRAAKLTLDEDNTLTTLTRISLPPLSQESLNAYAGRYANAEIGGGVSVIARDGKLFLVAAKEYPLQQIAPDAFSADYP